MLCKLQIGMYAIYAWILEDAILYVCFISFKRLTAGQAKNSGLLNLFLFPSLSSLMERVQFLRMMSWRSRPLGRWSVPVYYFLGLVRLAISIAVEKGSTNFWERIRGPADLSRSAGKGSRRTSWTFAEINFSSLIDNFFSLSLSWRTNVVSYIQPICRLGNDYTRGVEPRNASYLRNSSNVLGTCSPTYVMLYLPPLALYIVYIC
jgi:hypothetical protein